jgi:glycosyltransferase involved in cell wall biosynthesis
MLISENEAPCGRRPHAVNPSLASVRVVLAVKNFAATPGVCHIGLGVTALNTQRVLRKNGVHCEAWAAQTSKELYGLITADERKKPERPITHVVISAPSWVQPVSFGDFSRRWPNIEFVQLNHSGTSYLSIDKYGIRNIRDVASLSLSLHNVRVAGNNPRFTAWLYNALGIPELLLPNLYDTGTYVNPVVQRRNFDPLRVGSFGAGRPWKNQLDAAEAAVQMARQLGVALELHVNTQRPDGGERMIESRKELFAGLRNNKLIEVPWALWPEFRKIVATMDLLISPSFDETFCVICADGIAEGVPSVVTAAMEWTAPSWWCQPHDPNSTASVGIGLLYNTVPAVHDARNRLHDFVCAGVGRWIRYLTGTMASRTP